MLFSDKSFCLFEINGLPLPPKNFTNLTQKIKPVEEWKDTGVYCQYYTVPWLYIHPFVYIPLTNFLQYFTTKIDRWSCQLSHFLLRKMISASSRFIQLKVQFFLYLKSTMVICTYSVHITMENFSRIFQGQNNRSTSQVAHFMFRKIFTACWGIFFI